MKLLDQRTSDINILGCEQWCLAILVCDIDVYVMILDQRSQQGCMVVGCRSMKQRVSMTILSAC